MYLESPNLKLGNHPSLFLAGEKTIENWQKEVVEKLSELSITIYNPRCATFDVTDPTASEKQILWEWTRLRNATHIIFWFPCETLCPIVLFELGAALERTGRHPAQTPKLFIGCHPDYKRKQDVQIQTNLMLGVTTIHSSIDDLVNAVKDFINGKGQ